MALKNRDCPAQPFPAGVDLPAEAWQFGLTKLEELSARILVAFVDKFAEIFDPGETPEDISENLLAAAALAKALARQILDEDPPEPHEPKSGSRKKKIP